MQATYQAALNSFAEQFRSDHINDVTRAEKHLDEIVEHFGLTDDPFEQARAVLRGEATRVKHPSGFVFVGNGFLPLP
ncbi:hypothetical protein MUO32_26480 [Shinella sp. CPCC 101442]|uniref:hypothetical protein n=1 Tax=Shinella sp. CPCC 101442 TaxID=2932265 RepID=UPI002152D77D|nr:hypothetical protein [Shinella sp. CPCC 101442]MCR6502578.1 hypothetical protein [Shinella sp. CPCC 101442]